MCCATLPHRFCPWRLPGHHVFEIELHCSVFTHAYYTHGRQTIFIQLFSSELHCAWEPQHAVSPTQAALGGRAACHRALRRQELMHAIIVCRRKPSDSCGPELHASLSPKIVSIQVFFVRPVATLPPTIKTLELLPALRRLMHAWPSIGGGAVPFARSVRFDHDRLAVDRVRWSDFKRTNHMREKQYQRAAAIKYKALTEVELQQLGTQAMGFDKRAAEDEQLAIAGLSSVAQQHVHTEARGGYEIFHTSTIRASARHTADHTPD